MIKVVRDAEPRVLRRNSTRWRDKLLRLRADPHATKKQIKAAESKYNHHEIKAQLKTMFADKCAYCEHKACVGHYGEIEHFRPKAVYPEYTFTWSNLLFSCAICNNASHKADHFPLDAAGNPLLIDPSAPTDDPSDHLEFRYDPVTRYALVYGIDDRGKSVEDVFDLNGRRGRKELLRHRSQYINQLRALIKVARTGDTDALTLVHEACMPHAEYAAFARALCQIYGIAQ
ncbi:HNH endonuclease [Candidatus Oscillochloris fontis]|uniref:HNH endonuclease n=1 Tax=Candidatus Oscillochloris fontis TaxID=2496868 RepID=UPI00101C9612|nr:HNH endonuclease [Candidatus Oscillochloris fontis]